VSGNGGELEVSAGMVIAYEPREAHGMRAESEELTLLAVIAPHPAGG
jgi:quercetin dioxygenase-like cupin family protein